MNVGIWLWIGTIGMLLGMVPLYFALVANKSEYDEGDYLSHFFVPLTAFTLYLAMSLGAATLVTGAGRIYYYGRYIDWSITTPLLLYSLVIAGVKGTGVKRTAMIVGLMGADFYMIVTGFLAGLSDNPHVKWSFYLCSCIAFVAIYGLLFGPFKKIALSGPNGADYMKKAPVLFGLWFLYPVVFLLGQEGLRILSPLFDAVSYTILDLVTKIAYGLWAVSLAKKSAISSGDFSPSVARTAAV